MMSTNFVQEFIASGTLMSCAPGRLLIGWGHRQWSAKPLATSPANFYFPDFFFHEPYSWFTQEHNIEITIDELISRLESAPAMPPAQSPPLQWHPLSTKLFALMFNDLKTKISTNHLIKGVPYLFETANGTIHDAQRLRSLIALLHYVKLHPAYAYGFWDATQGILGATPELLFSNRHADGLTIEAAACAGTRALNSIGDSFMADPKMRHEHQLVVQGISESLAPFGKVTTGAMRILDLPKLSHLFTPIILQMTDKIDFDTIVRSMHPTPALGAFPREPGMTWLKTHQNAVNRKRYGAPVGFVKQNQSEGCCYVAIRNMQWTPDEVRIGAGCGVVYQSSFDEELDEIRLKIHAIKDLLYL